MQPVKITEDAFYNSITLRIGAQGYDYTVDADDKVVSGSRRPACGTGVNTGRLSETDRLSRPQPGQTSIVRTVARR